MHPSIRALAILVVAAASAASPLAAQRTPARAGATQTATVFDVTPYAGYARFGALIDGPLGTSIRTAGTPIIGAQLGLALGPNLGLVGNVAYGSADLQVGVPILGGIDVGTSKHVIYDANLEYRVPMQSAATTRSLTPFVQAGAGAITTKLENALLHTSTTNFAGNLGGGVDISLGRGFGARAMVKDYIGRFDASGDTGLPVKGDVSHNVAGSLGLRLSF